MRTAIVNGRARLADFAPPKGPGCRYQAGYKARNPRLRGRRRRTGAVRGLSVKQEISRRRQTSGSRAEAAVVIPGVAKEARDICHAEGRSVPNTLNLNSRVREGGEGDLMGTLDALFRPRQTLTGETVKRSHGVGERRAARKQARLVSTRNC